MADPLKPIEVFKTCFIVAADRAEIHPNQLGLRDFLLEDCASVSDPFDFAVRALEYFCVEEERFNGNIVGLTAVIRFLERVTGTHEQPEAVKALAGIMKTTPTRNALLGWAKTWFS